MVTAGRGRAPALAWLFCSLLGSRLALAAPVEYRLTPTHSFVHFEWPHAGLSTLQGRFDRVAGRVTIDRDARTGHGRVELRLDSVNTGRPALDQALRRSLGAESEAVSTFEIESFRFDGTRPVAALGRWRWRGVERTLELRAERFNCYFSPLLRREVCGGDFEAVVKRSLHGVNWGLQMGVADETKVVIQVEAVKQ